MLSSMSKICLDNINVKKTININLFSKSLMHHFHDKTGSSTQSELQPAIETSKAHAAIKLEFAGIYYMDANNVRFGDFL